MLAVDVSFSSKIIRRGDDFSIYIDITNGFTNPVLIVDVPLTAAFGFITQKPNEDSSKRVKFSIDTGLGYSSELTSEIQPKTKSAVVQPGGKFRVEYFVKAGYQLWWKPRADTYTVSSIIQFKELKPSSPHEKKEEHTSFTIKSGWSKEGVSYAGSTSTDSYFPVSIEISIFPSIAGVLIGTLIGSILGTLARSRLEDFGATFFYSLFTGMIFGFMAGVILMRKKDVQQFITIEDIWGGLLIGFIVGYYGRDIFERLLDATSFLGGPSTPTDNVTSTIQVSPNTSNGTVGIQLNWTGFKGFTNDTF